MQSNDPAAGEDALSWRQRTQAIFAIAALKLVVLLVDTNPRFFLWDSVTYLEGAVGGPLPRDRSFLYSYLIRAFAVTAHSLHALVIAQTLAGIASAYLVFLILRRFLSVRQPFALAAALVLAAAPEQLFYERMVMAEAFGGLLWLGYVALVLAYLHDGRWRWLPLVALIGILTIAFRLNGTAVILLSSLTLPLWRAWWIPAANPARERWRRLAVPLALAVACTAVAHVGYRHLVGAVAHTSPGYIGTEGLFLLGFVAPAVRDEDFRDTGCAPELLRHVRVPLADPTRREGQLWHPEGLWSVMQRECAQPEQAADRVARRAARRIGGLLLPMAFATVAQYFDRDETTWRMDSDLGRKGMLPLELIDLAQKHFFLDVKPIAFTDTLTSVWFQHSRWWLTASFLLAPFVAVAMYLAVRRSRFAATGRMLALLLFGLFLSQFLLSPVIVFRYLHPFPPLMILAATTLLAHTVMPTLRAATAARRRTADPAAASPVRERGTPA